MKRIQNRPSAGPSVNCERRWALKFRLAIAFIITIGAGFGIGKCIFDKKGPVSAGSSDIQAAEQPDAGKKRTEIMLKRCHTDLMRVVNFQCGEINEEEMRKRYLERERSNLEKRAAEIIDKLGITDADDQSAIFKAILKGCTEVKYASGNNIKFGPPSLKKQCLDPIDLNEEPKKNWLDISEEDYKELTANEKEVADLYRDKKVEEALRKISFDDTNKKIQNLTQSDEEFRNLGLPEYYQKFFDLLEETRTNILEAGSNEEKRSIICNLITKGVESDLSDKQKEKISKLEESGFGNFSIVEPESSKWFLTILMSLAGMSENELDEVCEPNFSSQ